VSYCIARQITSLEHVHSHVGYEPSGQSFNAVCLNREKLPHNPLINAGAIMTCSLIEPDLEPSERFEIIRKYYKDLTGNQGDIGFNNSIFLSEQHHADRNMSLAYYMRENKAFSPDVGPGEIQKHLNLYFQCCSITINSELGGIIASTLANGGTCPITNHKIFDTEVVKDCLSLMYMCGMYDYSGQFAFEIGFPAKSGVSGCLFIVIPNKMGICVWSPRLDEMGNTVRGVEFCKLFNKKTNNKYHIFHTIINTSTDITNKKIVKELFINACASNDIEYIKQNINNIDVNNGDYDNRTPIHLAAEEGNIEVVKILIEHNVIKDPSDRWGYTPLYSVNLKIQELTEQGATDQSPIDHDKIDIYKEISALLTDPLEPDNSITL
jgi:glutaminase